MLNKIWCRCWYSFHYSQLCSGEHCWMPKIMNTVKINQFQIILPKSTRNPFFISREFTEWKETSIIIPNDCIGYKVALIRFFMACPVKMTSRPPSIFQSNQSSPKSDQKFQKTDLSVRWCEQKTRILRSCFNTFDYDTSTWSKSGRDFKARRNFQATNRLLNKSDIRHFPTR